MNVSSVIPGSTTPPAIQPAKPANPKLVTSEVAAPLSDKEARAQAFYMREEEPWKKVLCTYSYCDEKPVTRPLTKEEYIEGLKLSSEHSLGLQQAHFDKFRRDLLELRPDLADKKFSYTLGDDAEIRILPADQTFATEELELLTASINKADGLKNLVHTHAKDMMSLVDHDSETFGNKYTLNLTNFQTTIDYGRVLTGQKDELHEAFIRQIHENAERRSEPFVDVLI
jgi:transcriptional regulator of acetoin/glycerol metabolism